MLLNTRIIFSLSNLFFRFFNDWDKLFEFVIFLDKSRLILLVNLDVFKFVVLLEGNKIDLDDDLLELNP